jgi:beta-glucosidase
MDDSAGREGRTGPEGRAGVAAAAQLAAATAVADRLTADERIRLTTGADYWTTIAAPHAGLRALRLADGPHGLRVQDDDNPDHLGLGRSMPATCFPPAVTLAASWDRDLVRRVGAALGREARAAGVDVQLGPGMNLKRSPLCGRNFEYFSEDPLHGGLLAASMVEGLQSQGVAACVKHFAVNNQETDRLRVSAQVDTRTLHELYLRTFAILLRECAPWTVMCAYNKINGVYASQDPWLLTEVLRDEWGFDGVVVSDWGAVHDPVAAVVAGLDLRMPGRPDDDRVREAVTTGALDPAVLDLSARRVALLAERTRGSEGPVDPVDFEEHHRLTRRAAAESTVLLTNNGILPLQLREGLRVAVVGELARSPRYQGAGSSAVTPTQLVTALDALTARAARAGARVTFAAGYHLDETAAGEADRETALVGEAAQVAEASDLVLLFLGLPGSYEAEGRDRHTITLPVDQLALVEAVTAVGTPTVVALSNGSSVTTAAWRDGVDAVVEFWLTGQAHGDSIADVLLGDVDPSGRLAETVPLRLEDTPSFLNFPGEASTVEYGERIFVGYRYFDALDLVVDFPFGHGLSYTTFAYDALTVTVHDLDDATAFAASVEVTNTGSRAGAEVVQLYVRDRGATMQVPLRELRAFAKVHLDPGQRTVVPLPVLRADLQHYDPASGAWVHEGGPATVEIGASSRDIRLSTELTLPGRPVTRALTVWSTYGEWRAHPRASGPLEALIAVRGGLRGRLGDLLADPTGRDSVLGQPLHTMLEFPGVPLDRADIDRILADISRG